MTRATLNLPRPVTVAALFHPVYPAMANLALAIALRAFCRARTIAVATFRHKVTSSFWTALSKLGCRSEQRHERIKQQVPDGAPQQWHLRDYRGEGGPS